MKVKLLRNLGRGYPLHKYKEGVAYDFESEAAADLISRGLAEAIEQPAKPRSGLASRHIDRAATPVKSKAKLKVEDDGE